MKKFTEELTRIDNNKELKSSLLKHCRLKPGEVWEDEKTGHRVGCLDAANVRDMKKLMGNEKARLAVHDPPYNLDILNRDSKNLGKVSVPDFIEWCGKWVKLSSNYLKNNAHLYIWIGADQKEGFQPLPEFMIMMREFREFVSRSFITMRNQRGYGTSKNWMAVRQELLYYMKGKPSFNTEAVYTKIPRLLQGYYKNVNGKKLENRERSKSEFIRAGNVWVDIQQVFYRMEENVSGCFAQKPLKAIERIIKSSTEKGELVIDFFSHSGTTLLACERLKRKCFTTDFDPVFAEITIRRLERFRETGKKGWQNQNPLK